MLQACAKATLLSAARAALSTGETRHSLEDVPESMGREEKRYGADRHEQAPSVQMRRESLSQASRSTGGCSARSVQQSSLLSLLPAALISASGSARGAASWTACRLLSSHRCPWMRRLRRTRQWQKTRMQKSRQQSGMLQNGRQLAHGDASSLSRDSELIHVSACRKDARGPEGSFLSGATIWMEQQIEEAPCR